MEKSPCLFCGKLGTKNFFEHGVCIMCHSMIGYFCNQCTKIEKVPLGKISSVLKGTLLDFEKGCRDIWPLVDYHLLSVRYLMKEKIDNLPKEKLLVAFEGTLLDFNNGIRDMWLAIKKYLDTYFTYKFMHKFLMRDCIFFADSINFKQPEIPRTGLSKMIIILPQLPTIEIENSPQPPTLEIPNNFPIKKTPKRIFPKKQKINFRRQNQLNTKKQKLYRR